MWDSTCSFKFDIALKFDGSNLIVFCHIGDDLHQTINILKVMDRTQTKITDGQTNGNLRL